MIMLHVTIAHSKLLHAVDERAVLPTLNQDPDEPF